MPESADIPCNVISMPKVRDGKLEWLQVIRSNDLFLGMPYNFVQFTSLQEIMAGWLGLECGSYNQISDSLHLYSQFERNILRSTPMELVAANADSLALPWKESGLVFGELERRIERMISPELQQGELERMSRWDGAPTAYRNILVVLVAEAARRRGWIDMGTAAISTCTNPAFKELWTRWVQRVEA